MATEDEFHKEMLGLCRRIGVAKRILAWPILPHCAKERRIGSGPEAPFEPEKLGLRDA